MKPIKKKYLPTS